MENKPLEDILSEQKEPATEPEAITDPPSGIADPPSDRLRDEAGRFKAKDETGVEPAKAETPTPTTAPPADQPQGLPQGEYAALRAVRDENKELKIRLAALEAAQSVRAQPQQVGDFWDDPNAFLEQRDTQLIDRITQRIEHSQNARRMDQSEAAAKAKYADYDQAFERFQQAVQVNPRLAVELAQAADPGEFAYSKGKAALALEQFGSIDELLKSERAKWEQEIKGQAPTLTLPSTTAADASVGARTGPDWSGPQPLKDIIR